MNVRGLRFISKTRDSFGKKENACWYFSENYYSTRDFLEPQNMWF